GMAVTGIADPDRLLRNDSGRPGVPLTLTKPLGVGVLNSRHKATGEVFPQAVAIMIALNRDAAAASLKGGATCATDVTGFGLLVAGEVPGYPVIGELQPVRADGATLVIR